MTGRCMWFVLVLTIVSPDIQRDICVRVRMQCVHRRCTVDNADVGRVRGISSGQLHGSDQELEQLAERAPAEQTRISKSARISTLRLQYMADRDGDHGQAPVWNRYFRTMDDDGGISPR